MRPRAAGVRAVAGRVASWWAGSHQPHGSWPSSRSPQTPFSQAAPILTPHLLRPGRAGQGRPERKVDNQGRVSGWSSCSRRQHVRVPPLGLKGCSWAESCCSCRLLREGSRASAGTLTAPSPRGPQSRPEASCHGLHFTEEQVGWLPRSHGVSGGARPRAMSTWPWTHRQGAILTGTMARSCLCRLLSSGDANARALERLPLSPGWKGTQEEPIRNPTCCGFLSSDPAFVKKGRETGEEPRERMGQRQ